MGVAEFRAELATDMTDTLSIPTSTYLPAVPDPPCGLIDYETDGPVSFQHGASQFTFHVALVYPFGDVQSAQTFFDTHKDPTVTTGFWRWVSDNTWTNADYVRPTSASEIRYVNLLGTDVLLVDFTLEVVL